MVVDTNSVMEGMEADGWMDGWNDFNVGVAGHKRKAALAAPVISAYVSIPASLMSGIDSLSFCISSLI